MNDVWQNIQLIEIGDIITGKTPPSKIDGGFADCGTPFITPRDMDGRRWIDETERYLSDMGLKAVKKSLVPPNSVAVSCIGSDYLLTHSIPDNLSSKLSTVSELEDELTIRLQETGEEQDGEQ